MALLGEEVVEEWLNRQGYFTIRGIKLGVDEIDILAFRPNPKGPPECRHIEVQVSTNPIAYISKVPKEFQKARGIGPDCAKERPDDELKKGIDEWIEKKFKRPRKIELLNRLFLSKWTRELVVNEVRHPEELELLQEHGIRILFLKDIVNELAETDTLIEAAAGNDLITLMQIGKEQASLVG
jgi:hypothetical protein